MEDEKLLELSLIEENERQKGLKIDFPISQEINSRFDFSRERLADYFYDYIKRLFSVALLVRYCLPSYVISMHFVLMM